LATTVLAGGARRPFVERTDQPAPRGSLVWAALAFWLPACFAFLTLARFSKAFRDILPLWVARYWFYVTMAGAIVATVAFLVAAARDERLSPSARVGWVLAFVVIGPIACPFYWWFHLRPRRQVRA
jgi:hypothetical protein